MSPEYDARIAHGDSESAVTQAHAQHVPTGLPHKADPRRLRIHRDVPTRDVPYVPTDEPVVAAMLRFAGVTSADVVYDLGCGDGRIPIAAAKHFGARGVGVDIDPLRIQEAREAAAKARVSDRVRFLCQSFFDTDFRDATVLMLYLLPSINVKLRPRFLSELRPGTRIVANYFGMGDWQPDMQATAHHRVLHQWIVPAFVNGTWHCVVDAPGDRHRLVIQLSRRFQTVSGTARVDRQYIPISEGRLFGDHLTFRLRDPYLGERPARFSCRIDGKTMRGSCQMEAIETMPITWGGIRAK